MIGTVDKYIAGAFALIALFLLVRNPDGVNKAITAIGSFNVNAIKALQGR